MEQKNDSTRKVKLLCSYGGKIQSRPKGYQLSYVGGETKILALNRTANLSEILAKLNSLSKTNNGGEISVKYQLPGENLDSLVSLIDDEDVEHMMVEYDRMQTISAKPPRLRIFVFNVSLPPVKPASVTNPDYLFGFDKEYQPSFGPPLDLLQIQGMVLPENGRRCFSNANVAIPVPAVPAVYRVPAGGLSGQGCGEQAVYNVVPMIPPVSERRMMVSVGVSEMGNGVGANANPPNF